MVKIIEVVNEAIKQERNKKEAYIKVSCHCTKGKYVLKMERSGLKKPKVMIVGE